MSFADRLCALPPAPAGAGAEPSAATSFAPAAAVAQRSGSHSEGCGLWRGRTLAETAAALAFGCFSWCPGRFSFSAAGAFFFFAPDA